MSQTLAAPSGTALGAIVAFPDGTTTTVDANGNISCPDQFSAAMLNAGFNYAASDAGQQSSAVSSVATVASSLVALMPASTSSQASSIAALVPASMSSQASSTAAIYPTTSSQASSVAALSPASMSSQASSVAALVPASTSSQASSWAAIATTVSSVASRTKSSFSW